MRPVTLLLASAVLLGLGSAEAAPDDSSEEGLTIVLKNGKDEKGKPKGCYFSARGKTMPLMDGTRLEVTLAARGRSRDFPVKILRAVVKDNTFEVSFPWPGRTFAPLLYQVKVELKVRKQARPIQQWLMTEYGYSQVHQEVVDRKMVSFAGEEERAAFAVENIAKIRGFVVTLDARRLELADLAKTPAASTEGWKETYPKLNQGLIDYRQALDGYFRQYVILLEQGFYRRILDAMRTLNRILRDHNRARPGTLDRLAGLGKSLATTIEKIKQYEPVPTEETLVPAEDEEDSDGGR